MMQIPKVLNDEIWDYCRLNNITSIDDFTIKLVRQGFTIEKFGATPVANERIVEKIVEVPVEVIKEINVADDAEIIRLNEVIVKLNGELDTIKLELENEKKKKKDIYGEG
jgi:hypothetical protein